MLNILKANYVIFNYEISSTVRLHQFEYTAAACDQLYPLLFIELQLISKGFVYLTFTHNRNARLKRSVNRLVILTSSLEQFLICACVFVK